MAEAFVRSGASWDKTAFSKNYTYALNLVGFESSSIKNSPNLSIFPLLAYHKICNDHYRNEKWQPFEPWTCNIDYLDPSGNMNATAFISSSTFTSLMTSIIDLENSNLPIDYFTSVLPRAQYSDESAIPVGPRNGDVTFSVVDPDDNTKGFLFDQSSNKVNDTIIRVPSTSVLHDGKYVSQLQAPQSQAKVTGIHGDLVVDNTGLKISALRSATALQKYKEIQNSNDPDFASQVLAHFGIKPKVDTRTSVFIGGLS